MSDQRALQRGMSDSRSEFEKRCPRLAKAVRDVRSEERRRRPCGRLGYCCACWLREQRQSGLVARMRHEATPWLYDQNDPRYARDWPYTLVQYHGGFRQRVYDWELAHGE